ncbi:MAG: glycosyltransferase [Nitrosomonadales bacterium]
MTELSVNGVARSLLGLLHELDYSKVDVDLFLFLHKGEWLGQIPKQVQLLPQNDAYASLCKTFNCLRSERRYGWLVLRTLALYITACCFKLRRLKVEEHGLNQITSLICMPFLPELSRDTYDLAISFAGFQDVTSRKVLARRKAGWIHTDYRIHHPLYWLDVRNWSVADYIVNVSRSAKEGFDAIYPQFRSRSISIENVLSATWVRRQVNDAATELISDPSRVQILTVGRLSQAKGLDRAVAAAALLKKQNIQFRWYVIGSGELNKRVDEWVHENQLEDCFFLLGEKANPYPYFAACDIYVQPSNFEGKAVAVREAQMLGKPVVIARYATAESQVRHGIDGLIAEMSAESVADAIQQLIENPELGKRLSANCGISDFSNRDEIEKIYGLMAI